MGMVLPVTMRTAATLTSSGTFSVFDGTTSASSSTLGAANVTFVEPTSVEVEILSLNVALVGGRAAIAFNDPLQTPTINLNAEL
jgi:hypothetical protein